MNSIKELEDKYIELGQEIERLKNESEAKYPLYFRGIQFGHIVKFDGLTRGKVVVNSFHCSINETAEWCEHTNTSTWQPVPICPKTKYFHGQLVWCWDENFINGKNLRLWNAITSEIFSITGNGTHLIYHNTEPFVGEYPQWALDAQKAIYAKLESK